MKTKIIALAAIVALLVLAGVAAAQSTDSGVSAGFTKCWNSATSCNSFKFNVVSLAPGYQMLHGYEYGCGYNDRIATGTAHVVGNQLYIGFSTNNALASGGGVPRLGSLNGIVDLSNGNLTYDYAYHYDSFHFGSGTGQWVNCTKEVISGGRDESQ
jgi:hypothetical protein